MDTNIFQAGNVTEMTSEVIGQLPHLLPEDIVDGIVYALNTKPHVLVSIYYYFFFWYVFI